jgi:hypothetical protein
MARTFALFAREAEHAPGEDVVLISSVPPATHTGRAAQVVSPGVRPTTRVGGERRTEELAARLVMCRFCRDDNSFTSDPAKLAPGGRGLLGV